MPLARTVYLTGMMGTGKSALGKSLAKQAHVPFVDLDAAIEERAGRSVRGLFADRGESGFRKLEREALELELAKTEPRVVALGGGALLDRTVRLRVLERGFLVALSADVATLVERLQAERAVTGRPLLDGEDLPQRLSELLDARQSGYREAHACLDTTQRSVEELAAHVVKLLDLNAIAVPLGDRTYAVDIVPGRAEVALNGALAALSPTRIVYVTDDVVAPLVASRLEPELARVDPAFVRVVLPTGERHKTLASVEKILRAAIDAPIDRRAVLVAAGGGVVTDMGGMAAALALRGIRWVAVPTTVLAMVDASVGGKTAVDLGAAKNAVGAFHQPARVVVDPSFTATESARAFRSGLAEVLKTALIGDAALYAELAQPGGAERLAVDRDPSLLFRAIQSSVAVKAGVVGRDEREAGERAHLNLGHTVGHALEAEGGFERLTHGEAVALGLVAALRIGVALHVTPSALAREITQVFARLGLPTLLDAEPLDRALRWVSYDKKRAGGELRLILVRAPGRVEIARAKPSDLPALLTPP